MEDKFPKIILYGAARCHKTQYYIELLRREIQPFEFHDVEVNQGYAEELRGLYKGGKLNFPTLKVGEKRLRNPSEKELLKWITRISDQSLKTISSGVVSDGNQYKE
jgi:arsenate reductase-like glutaredoxin family protein